MNNNKARKISYTNYMLKDMLWVIPCISNSSSAKLITCHSYLRFMSRKGTSVQQVKLITNC